jgi:hypothetical protein
MNNGQAIAPQDKSAFVIELVLILVLSVIYCFASFGRFSPWSVFSA